MTVRGRWELIYRLLRTLAPVLGHAFLVYDSAALAFGAAGNGLVLELGGAGVVDKVLEDLIAVLVFDNQAGLGRVTSEKKERRNRGNKHVRSR